MEIVRYNGYKLYLKEDYFSNSDNSALNYFTVVLIDNPIYLRKKKRWYTFLFRDKHIYLGTLDYHVSDSSQEVSKILTDLDTIIEKYQDMRARRRQLRRKKLR